MERYKENVQWLTLVKPLRNLSISAAYLTPFFLDNGLSLAQVFLLQSVFSLSTVLWEVPSGYVADKIGHALSIKLSLPIAAVALVLYGFSGELWQFALLEVALAISVGLLSGVDSSLLYNSLKAQGKQDDYVRLSQRGDALGYASVAVAVPLAWLLVEYVGLGATLVADGLLTAVGAWLALRLQEAPHYREAHEAESLSLRHAVGGLLRTPEARWLIVLGAVLSAATYLGFWLSAPYYAQLGIPVAWFGGLLAVRSLWKAWLAHRIHVSKERFEQSMLGYALLVAVGYGAMVTGNIWLLWLLLAHDAVQALHVQPVNARLNQLFTHEYRATLHGVNNLVRRLGYGIFGPVAGWLADTKGLRFNYAALGIGMSGLALLAVYKLHALKKQ